LGRPSYWVRGKQRSGEEGEGVSEREMKEIREREGELRGFNKDTVEGMVDKKRGEEEVKIANLLSRSTVFVKCAVK
jgi:hypothetical protein